MRRVLQSTVLPSATLAEFYRFAVLLAGNAKVAERVMAEVLAEVQSQIEQLRNETSRRAWLATRIRQRCLDEKPETPPAPGLLRGAGEIGGNPEVLKIEAFLLAQRVHALPEPERTALALFYMDFFSTEEIAQILKTTPDELAATIGRARSLLRESLKAMRQDSPLSS
jgi:DNA-directed RNA polymerase specialized sigma24 family protein